MRNKLKIIVVAGANGNLGKLVVESLIQKAKKDQSEILIKALVRKGNQTNQSIFKALFDQQSESQRIQVEQVDYLDADDLLRVCKEAFAVVSTLQGLEDVIIGAQSKLLEAAIKCNVSRFVPSDFSADFTKLPVGSHRNFDLRRKFHQKAYEIIRKENSKIELTSIFQGGFTELLGSGWVLFDYKKNSINYFGSAESDMEFTTMPNTAEFTAAVALDENACPRYLYIAGEKLTPQQAKQRALEITGVEFKLNRVMPIGMLNALIKILKIVKPGKKNDVMPIWVALQYGYCGALGVMSPARLDNNRYHGINWTPINSVIKEAFVKAQK